MRPLTNRMMLVAATAVLAASLTPAEAGVQTKRYEAGVVFPWANVDDPTGGAVAQDGTIDVGTVVFQPPFDSTTLRFTGRDDHDPAGTGLIHVAVCQDRHGDPLTCRPDEASARGCITETQAVTLTGAVTDKPVYVFVHAVSGCPNGFLVPPEFLSQPAYATQGAITVRS